MKALRLAVFLAPLATGAQIVPDGLVRTILSEVSAERAFEHTRALAEYPRYGNSSAFFEAAEYVARHARALGLANVRTERFENSGPAWDAVEGELDLVEPEARRLSSLADTAVLVAQGSGEGDVTAELVDVGEGTRAADYEGKSVKGRILLATGSAGAVWQAMGHRGAVGVLCASYRPFFDRPTPPDAVAWGRAPSSMPAMMISPRQGDELRRLLRQDAAVKVRMHIRVKRSSPGAIGMLMGEIPGAVKDQDIVLVAHLDHQKPGANDNASGSGAVLELLATVKRLVERGKIPAPRRTLRFWWSTEISSERAYFRKHPEEARKILLAVNLDQAGGDIHAENHLIAILSPDWLPSYADDLIENLIQHVTGKYAVAERAPSPLVTAPNGSRQALHAVYWDYAPLSDHIAFEAQEVGVPCISLAVPSLHVIHTSMDTSERIDPTWLKRSMLFTLAPALWAASADAQDARAMLDYTFRRAVTRLAGAADVKARLPIEQQRLDSVRALSPDLATEPFKKQLAVIATELAR